MSVNLIESTGAIPQIQQTSPAASAAEQGLNMPEGPLKERFDSYEPQPPAQSAGLYEVGLDGDGNRIVKFDNPEKDAIAKKEQSTPKEEPAKDAEKPVKDAEKPAKDAEKPAKDAEDPVIAKTTVSTDKVDREIEKLKQAKRELERQIASADAEKVKPLEAKLSQIEAELKMKDNDAYRRRHMEIV